MKTISHEFAQKNIGRILQDMSKSTETIIITRQGKPLARVIPFNPSEQSDSAYMSNCLYFEEDLSSLDLMSWDNCK